MSHERSNQASHTPPELECEHYELLVNLVVRVTNYQETENDDVKDTNTHQVFGVHEHCPALAVHSTVDLKVKLSRPVGMFICFQFVEELQQSPMQTLDVEVRVCCNARM